MGELEEEEKKIEEASKGYIQPVPEIVLRVHCEGCGKKVCRDLKQFQGVESVVTDCTRSSVFVRGKNVDPLKVLVWIQGNGHRQVELISPSSKPPATSDS